MFINEIIVKLADASTVTGKMWLMRFEHTAEARISHIRTSHLLLSL